MRKVEMSRILEEGLPSSRALDRRNWAQSIINEQIELIEFKHLLFSKSEVTSRFMWLLSDIGELKPNVLLDFLPYLLQKMDQINYLEVGASFANYWLISGVPEKNETQAIDLLFAWVLSGNSNVTNKSRSVFVLYKLTEKYPELKNELRIVLLDQMHKSTPQFANRARKLLIKLDK